MLNKTTINNVLTTVALAALTLTSSALAEPIRLAPDKIRLLRERPLLEHVDRGRVLRPAARPDLAVTAVSISRPRVSRGPTYLKVKVANIGRANWRSAPNQQVLVASINGREFVVSRNIKSLDAGASRSFAITVPSHWGRGVEFPPSVKVSISMDPDIRLDGNPANDDANSSNDRKVLSGTAANAMVGG